MHNYNDSPTLPTVIFLPKSMLKPTVYYGGPMWMGQVNKERHLSCKN